MRSLEKLREDARAIFDAGVRAVEPGDLVRTTLQRHGSVIEIANRRYDLSGYRHLYVVGAGKASAPMALAAEDLLGEGITAAIVVVKYGHSLPLTTIKVIEAGHPVPDQNGIAATREILEIARKATAEDLILCLISGGASALLVAPADDLTLEDKQTITRSLLSCGADIRQVNAVRKHMSAVKGGRLAHAAYPASVIALILSDVIGDSIETIASGPTSADPTTFGECLEILDGYRLRERISPAVGNLLERGAAGSIGETPKPGDSIFNRVHNVIIGNNQTALGAAREHAAELGYRVLVTTDPIRGEAREAAVAYGQIIRQTLAARTPAGMPVCMISGGETTVTVRGNGSGGRNQEFALAAAMEIMGKENVVILSAGTDGADGPTEAAGAIVDGLTIGRGMSQGLDAKSYLERNDSYHFLNATHDLLITGPTLTNVMDVQVAVVD